MTKVRMLFAPDGAGLGERIAMKLAEQDFSLAFGAYDEGDLDPAPAVATIMVWSADVHQSGRLLSAANDARKAKRLIPVAIGNPEILPAFQALTPVDLLGWDGKDADPRWQFILDEIALAEKAQALTPPTEDIRRPAIKMGLPDEYKLAGGFAGILFLTAVAGIAVGRQVSAPTLEATAIAGLGEGQAVIASADGVRLPQRLSLKKHRLVRCLPKIVIQKKMHILHRMGCSSIHLVRGCQSSRR
ncbi:MAG: hypothetical protein AAFR21_04135 [Pseudomonadota bacterium]